jgi:hypothetical protein
LNQPKSNIPCSKPSNSIRIATDYPAIRDPCLDSVPAQEEPDQFDITLSHVIDKTLKQVLGKTNTHTIYKHLKKNGCSPNEIPKNPNALSTELRNILGNGTAQIAGAASILEQTILENLTAELKTERLKPYSAPFAENIKKLKKSYNKN